MNAHARVRAAPVMYSEFGEPLSRDVRPFTFSYKGHSVTVDRPGYYPAGDNNDDAVFVGDRIVRINGAAATRYPGDWHFAAPGTEVILEDDKGARRPLVLRRYYGWGTI